MSTCRTGPGAVVPELLEAADRLAKLEMLGVAASQEGGPDVGRALGRAVPGVRTHCEGVVEIEQRAGDPALDGVAVVPAVGVPLGQVEVGHPVRQVHDRIVVDRKREPVREALIPCARLRHGMHHVVSRAVGGAVGSVVLVNVVHDRMAQLVHDDVREILVDGLKIDLVAAGVVSRLARHDRPVEDDPVAARGVLRVPAVARPVGHKLPGVVDGVVNPPGTHARAGGLSGPEWSRAAVGHVVRTLIDRHVRGTGRLLDPPSAVLGDELDVDVLTDVGDAVVIVKAQLVAAVRFGAPGRKQVVAEAVAVPRLHLEAGCRMGGAVLVGERRLARHAGVSAGGGRRRGGEQRRRYRAERGSAGQHSQRASYRHV